MLGQHTVRVVSDKVHINQLHVELISNVHIKFEQSLLFGGIVFTVEPVSALTTRYQVGIRLI